jgi:hypothetical protein
MHMKISEDERRQIRHMLRVLPLLAIVLTDQLARAIALGEWLLGWLKGATLALAHATGGSPLWVATFAVWGVLLMGVVAGATGWLAYTAFMRTAAGGIPLPAPAGINRLLHCPDTNS